MPSILCPPHHARKSETSRFQTLRGLACGSVTSGSSPRTRRGIYRSHALCMLVCEHPVPLRTVWRSPPPHQKSTAQTACAVLALVRRYRAASFHEACYVYSHAFREDKWSEKPTIRVITNTEGQMSHSSHRTSNNQRMRCLHSLPAHISAASWPSLLKIRTLRGGGPRAGSPRRRFWVPSAVPSREGK